MIEFILQLIGLRKCGCQDEPDSQDYAFRGTDRQRYPKRVDLLNTYYQDQKNIGACTGFGTTRVWEIQSIINKRKKVSFDAWKQWNNQKLDNTDITDSSGDTLQHAVKVLKRVGLQDVITGNWYKPFTFHRIEYYEMREALANHQPIITGARVGSPMCDKNHYFIPDGNRGGHCIAIIGYDDEKQHWICLNSWKWFGWKRTGKFYIKYGDENSLFSKYVLNLS